jgi:hypothetical protein
MKTVETHLSVGAGSPFSLLHVTDTHLMLVDDRDDEKKHLLAQDRDLRWKPASQGTQMLEYVKEIARKTGAPIAHTGDLCDFVTHANLEEARRLRTEFDLLFTAGNHEFSQYMYFEPLDETPEYRAESLPLVEEAFGGSVRFSARVMGGVNLVFLDDSYYSVEAEQLAALRREVERGYPVVLFMHVPLYSPEMRERFFVSPTVPLWMLGTPEEEMADYSPERKRQQKTDGITREFCEYVVSEERICALVTGHLHADFECVIGGRLPQIVTDMTTVRILRFE